jgi:hypothetical protein
VGKREGEEKKRTPQAQKAGRSDDDEVGTTGSGQENPEVETRGQEYLGREIRKKPHTVCCSFSFSELAVVGKQKSIKKKPTSV